MSNSNYPDDIRCWDWHPQSPFYEGPLTEEEAISQAEAKEIEGDAAYDRKRDQEAEEAWESVH